MISGVALNRTGLLVLPYPSPAEDVLWFKPVELRTKWGRRGHIKEPLGKWVKVFGLLAQQISLPHWLRALTLHLLFAARNPWPHEVPVRRTAEVPGHSADDLVQAGLSQVDIRSLRARAYQVEGQHPASPRGRGENGLAALVKQLFMQGKNTVSYKNKCLGYLVFLLMVQHLEKSGICEAADCPFFDLP